MKVSMKVLWIDWLRIILDTLFNAEIDEDSASSIEIECRSMQMGQLLKISPNTRGKYGKR